MPKIPKAATKKTEQGLKAFTAYWLETMTYAYATGDLKPMKAISGDECTACSNAAEGISQIYTKDGWVVGGAITPATTQTNFKTTSDGEYQILFQHAQEAIDVYRADGTNELKGESVDSSVLIMIAVHEDGHWTAKNVEKIG